MYFVTILIQAGCCAGQACPYLHPAPSVDERAVDALPAQAIEQRTYQAEAVPASRVITKPVSALQVANPREFQLQQLRRRFSPTEVTSAGVTTLTFKLIPSDPDFPYDLAALKCVLRVPADYPAPHVDAAPTLRVTNAEMERGFQANVEKGFDELLQSGGKDQTLLGLLKALDRRLEAILAGRKADTVKLIANAGPSRSVPSTVPRCPPTSSLEVDGSNQISTSPPLPSTPMHSAQERTAAEARREAETRQLAARMGRLPGFAKSADGIAYTVPVAPAQEAVLLLSLQGLRTAVLFVPRLYPLLPCRIELQGVSHEASRPIERAFEQHAQEKFQMSLTGHINFLATNLHVLAEKGAAMEKENEEDRLRATFEAMELAATDRDGAGTPTVHSDEEHRSHVHVIPRPPEWNYGRSDPEGSASGSDSSDEDSGNNSVGEEVTEHASAQVGPSTTERGIAVSFPALELHGIELLKLAVLSIIVKCERCKDSLDVHNLRHTPGTPRSESCRKCASVLQIGTVTGPI